MHRDPTAAGKMGKAANQSRPPLKPETRWSVRRFDSKASAHSPPTNEEHACAQMMKVWLPLNIEVFVDERVEKEQEADRWMLLPSPTSAVQMSPAETCFL